MTQKPGKSAISPAIEALEDAELDAVQGGLKMSDPETKENRFAATDDLWIKGGQEGEPKDTALQSDGRKGRIIA
jgi:hypothetical protein